MPSQAPDGRVIMHILENEGLTLKKNSLSGNGLLIRPGLDAKPDSDGCDGTRSFWPETMAILWSPWHGSIAASSSYGRIILAIC